MFLRRLGTSYSITGLNAGLKGTKEEKSKVAAKTTAAKSFQNKISLSTPDRDVLDRLVTDFDP